MQIVAEKWANDWKTMAFSAWRCLCFGDASNDDNDDHLPEILVGLERGSQNGLIPSGKNGSW